MFQEEIRFHQADTGKTFLREGRAWTQAEGSENGRPGQGWSSKKTQRGLVDPEQTETILDVVPQVLRAVEDVQPRSDVIIFGL